MTAFQRFALAAAAEERERQAKAHADDDYGSGAGFGGQMNAGSQPFGGGRRVEHRSYTNMSAKTGKAPDELIESYTESK